MKQKYFYLIAALATATFSLSSCIDDEYDPALIRLSVDGLGNTATTRATSTDALQNTQFISGLGIQVEAYETGGASTYTTGTYTTTSNVGSTEGSILLSGSLYYHPTSNIDICAYYPSTVTSAGTTTFSVQTDQTSTNVANYRSSDLMYATKLTDKAKGTVWGLTFNHALSQVIVNISPGTGLTAGDITANVSAVKINNTITASTVAFAAGVITATASSGTSDIDITGSDVASNIGIIIPQTVTSGTTFVTITYNSTPYTYALTSNATFAAGSKYIYNFTLNQAGLELQSVTITDWTNGGSTAGSISL